VELLASAQELAPQSESLFVRHPLFA